MTCYGDQFKRCRSTRRDARIDQNAMTTQLRCRASSARNTSSFARKYCSKTRVDSQFLSIKSTTQRDAFSTKNTVLVDILFKYAYIFIYKYAYIVTYGKNPPMVVHTLCRSPRLAPGYLVNARSIYTYHLNMTSTYHTIW